MSQSDHLDQVHHALEVLFRTDRDLHHERFRTQFVLELFHHAVRISTRSVHLIDERNSRNLVSLHLPVNGDGLTLHSADAAKNKHCPVQNSEASLHLNCEVHVAWGVDQVDIVSLIIHARCSAGDGDTTLTLQFHVVHRGPITISADLFDLMDSSGVEQNAFTESGLTRVNVGADTNVT